MPTSFLTKYYAQVDDNLNDIPSSKRVTNAKKYELLNQIEATIWERLLTITGQESMLGYTEVDIVIEPDKADYHLPGNFRQFLKLEEREGGDRNKIISTLSSVSFYSGDQGVVINGGQRGMRIQPVPTMSGNKTFTLCYMAGPIPHFSGEATQYTPGVADTSISTFWVKTADTDAGPIIYKNNFYTGCLLRAYDMSATTLGYGHPDTRQVLANIPFLDTGPEPDELCSIFTIKDWTHEPAADTEDFQVETVPALPEGLDAIYALDAALHIMGRRGKAIHRREMIAERAELWNACKNYFLSNTADRGPARIIPLDPDEPDDGFEDNYDWS